MNSQEKIIVRSFIKAMRLLIQESEMAADMDLQMDGSGELGGHIFRFHEESLCKSACKVAEKLGVTPTMMDSLLMKFERLWNHPNAIPDTYYIGFYLEPHPESV